MRVEGRTRMTRCIILEVKLGTAERHRQRMGKGGSGQYKPTGKDSCWKVRGQRNYQEPGYKI